MNVLANLKAILSPKTAAGAATSPGDLPAGGSEGGVDFAALFDQTAAAGAAVIPALPSAKAVADGPSPDLAAAALPNPEALSAELVTGLPLTRPTGEAVGAPGAQPLPGAAAEAGVDLPAVVLAPATDGVPKDAAVALTLQVKTAGKPVLGDTKIPAADPAPVRDEDASRPTKTRAKDDEAVVSAQAGPAIAPVPVIMAPPIQAMAQTVQAPRDATSSSRPVAIVAAAAPVSGEALVTDAATAQARSAISADPVAAANAMPSTLAPVRQGGATLTPPSQQAPVAAASPALPGVVANVAMAPVVSASVASALGEATSLLRFASRGAAEGKAKVPGRVSAISSAAEAVMPRMAVKPDGSAQAPVTGLAAVRHRDTATPDLPTTDASVPPSPDATNTSADAITAAPLAAPASARTADLSASLGQRVIDMSAGGQWIDGLAKEIATLAAGSGQGTFHLSPPHLGPMRVDVRNGDLGAEVSLTVQTEAAEAALRQDGDRLKTEGQLSAFRISDVRIERVHHIAEPQRSDTNNGQSGNSGNSGNWNQGNGQATLAQGQGQNQAQGQAQANGQQSGRKSSFGDAVLSQAEPSGGRSDDDGQNGLRRARYA
ncbi:hypothetical protein BH10PSE12_BH10PSE12_24070 [soil metagenome]